MLPIKKNSAEITLPRLAMILSYYICSKRIICSIFWSVIELIFLSRERVGEEKGGERYREREREKERIRDKKETLIFYIHICQSNTKNR